MTVKEPLFKTLATKLESDLPSFEGGQLPGIQRLAAKYGTTYPTMWKAVNVLARKGILDVSRGRKMRIKGRDQDLGSVASKIAEWIRENITDGTYRAGEAIPKTAYFTNTYHVSPLTFRSAIVQLSEEGLIHKVGRSWIVGNPSAQKHTISHRPQAESPVVLALFSHASSCTNMLRQASPSSRTFTAFQQELQSYGIAHQIAFTREGTQEVGLANTFEEVKDTIRKLGSRYCGTYLLWQQWAKPDPAFLACAEHLLKYDRPVVWYDPIMGLDRSDFWKHIRLRGKHSGRMFSRCAVDDKVAVDLSVKGLAEFGHSKIAILRSLDTPWAKRRVSLLTQSMTEAGMEGIVIDDDEIEGDPLKGFVELDFSQIYNDLEKSFFPKNSAKTGKPSRMVEDLLASKATAVVSLNDESGVFLHLKLKFSGIKVPDTISTMSFDNATQFKILPMTSVDFGHESLGYFSAHLFIQDIPIKRDRYHNVRSNPMIMYRGSLGKARQVQG